MTNLSREDIQAIAQELSRINNTNSSATSNSKNNTQHASTRAQGGAISEKINNSKSATKNSRGSGGEFLKNLATIGLFLFWAVVFVVLLIKLTPYI